MTPILKVIVAAVVSFVVLFVLSKLMGKKQIAQLDFVDYVIGISLGSIAAEMAFDIETPWYYFVIGMAVFFVLDLAINIIGRKGPFLKRLLKGKPQTLIYEGKIQFDSLKKSGLDVNELIAMTRVQGYFDITKVYYAVLETSGQLSVMPTAAERPAAAKDLPIEIEAAKLPCYLIVDGLISYSGLGYANKDKCWLLKKLEVESEKELKKIILASYDSENDGLIVHYKKED